MNNRERVLTTLQHKQPDVIPYEVSFTQRARTKMIEFCGTPDFESKLGIKNCLTGLECEPANSWKETKPDIWQDQFGVQWNRSIDKDIGNVCNRLVTPETLRAYQFPDPHDPSRFAKYRDVVGKKGERFVVANIGFSLFERAWILAGMEDVLMAMVIDKSFVHDLLDRILEFNLKIIEHACAYDIDAMRFGDDWGSQASVLMGPQLWQEFIKPRIRQMYGLVKSKGKFVFIHSCGKVQELFPDLIECGLDVFNPFQPEVMDVGEMKRRFGDRLTFFGGISTQQTLPYGTVQQVKDEVKRLLDVVGRNGGYIAAPAHGIPGDARPENVIAMVETLQSQ